MGFVQSAALEEAIKEHRLLVAVDRTIHFAFGNFDSVDGLIC